MEVKEKVKLQVINDNFLPTGKQHISYSELDDWYSCSERHRLKHIEKIQLDSENIHSIYGTAMHNALENIVNFHKGIAQEKIEPQKHKEMFLETANNFFETLIFENEEEKEKFLLLLKSLEESFEKILPNTIEWLDSTFPGWEPVDAEVPIYEPLSDKENQVFFKGFIDLVIKVPNPKYKKNNDKYSEFVYFVLDWKTSSWGWTRDKKESFKKQAQLLLYKHYYSKIKNINKNDIKCCWVLVKRTHKKGTLPFEAIVVSSTEEKVNKAELLARQMVTSLKLKLYFKNTNECLYCMYRTTNHCTIQPLKK